MNYSERWGLDVEEAVKLALMDLKVSREEVEITVLTKPSKGFLGIGQKLAQVRVEIIKKEEEKPESQPMKAPQNKETTIERQSMPKAYDSLGIESWSPEAGNDIWKMSNERIEKDENDHEDPEQREYPVHELYKKMLNGDIYAGYQYAKYAVEHGDEDECLDVLETIEKDNEITDARWLQLRWRLAGKCYWKHDLRKAIECFENAYELHSKDALWDLLECMIRAKEIDYSWRLNDKQMTIIEEYALDGNGTLSFQIGLAYMVWNNRTRGKLFFKNALGYLNYDDSCSTKSRFFLWWLDENDDNGEPYDPAIIRKELEKEAEKGDLNCEYYIRRMDEKLQRETGGTGPSKFSRRK